MWGRGANAAEKSLVISLLASLPHLEWIYRTFDKPNGLVLWSVTPNLRPRFAPTAVPI